MHHTEFDPQPPPPAYKYKVNTYKKIYVPILDIFVYYMYDAQYVVFVNKLN